MADFRIVIALAEVLLEPGAIAPIRYRCMDMPSLSATTEAMPGSAPVFAVGVSIGSA